MQSSVTSGAYHIALAATALQYRDKQLHLPGATDIDSARAMFVMTCIEQAIPPEARVFSLPAHMASVRNFIQAADKFGVARRPRLATGYIAGNVKSALLGIWVGGLILPLFQAANGTWWVSTFYARLEELEYYIDPVRRSSAALVLD